MKQGFLMTLAGFFMLCDTAGMAQQDFSRAEIKTTQVTGNIYMLNGTGGNIGASVGPDGILIIDDKFAPLADKIRAALRKIGAISAPSCTSSPIPIRGFDATAPAPLSAGSPARDYSRLPPTGDARVS